MGLQSILHGRPTGPMIRKMMAHTEPHLRVIGHVFDHALFEKLTGEMRDNHRYRRLVHLWRKQVWRSTGVMPVTLHGIGYEIPDGQAATETHFKHTKSKIKGITREMAYTATIPDDRYASTQQIEHRDAIVSSFKYVAELGRIRAKEAGLLLGSPKLPRLPR